MSMMAPKNTTNTHYALALVAVVGSLMCFYASYSGPALIGATVAPKYAVYFFCFMVGAFGAGFLIAPKFLMSMKTYWNPPFDKNHEFLGRFCGFSMLTIGYTMYFFLGTNDAFKVGALWLGGAGLLGPCYALLYLDPIMTPDGIAGDPFLILVGGILALLGTM